MDASTNSQGYRRPLRLQLCRQRRKVWWISGLAICFSLIGLIRCYLTPSIGAPLRPGLDFTGGTQIQLDRVCVDNCDQINTTDLLDVLEDISLSDENGIKAPNLSGSRAQLLDGGKSLSLRLPFLSAAQGQKVVESIAPLAGPFQVDKTSVDTIGPSLGGKLLESSLTCLIVAFAGIALYISFRYDRRYAFLALVALAHDLIIVCGIFAWLGLLISLEVNSLFAVALLTIAGYSVNDTVVVFDRIRERSREDSPLPIVDQIDRAVSATLTRTLYTSGTTLLPLVALIIWGGSTLYWFAIALASGVLVGSWSSIALAPSLLSLKKDFQSK
ncbi:protein translocase subunit SecF [Prochlorococcus sp. MIT 1300]|uniref:protein translocase subunit SecF n=1 Tax=Prochlorococcus sp. MIT 1300 TaxID=3096218 RepID=UPI002A75C105|nr:protein translocase subunit SecF [Prochlorococcus sp. MIT 1300]